jgi:hypothetical protein
MEAIQRNALRRPWGAVKLLPKRVHVPVRHEHLTWYARQLARQITHFGWSCQSSLIRHRESILHRQFIQARLADIATELYVASCVYSRLSALMVDGTIDEPLKLREFRTGTLYLRLAQRRNRVRFDDLRSNDDEEVVAVARDQLGTADA